MEDEDDLRLKVRKVELAAIYKKLKDGRTLNSRESSIIDDEARRNIVRKEINESLKKGRQEDLPTTEEWGINDSNLQSEKNLQLKEISIREKTAERKRIFLKAYENKLGNTRRRLVERRTSTEA